jgi:hypothetical protein
VRLKEDTSSWASSGIIKRDANHGGPVKTPAKAHKRKNTKRFCKGKVGREHDYDFVKVWGFGFFWHGGWDTDGENYCYADYACRNCGRVECGVKVPMETIALQSVK